MKSKLTIFLAVVFVAATSFATLLFDIEHTGYLCPGGHVWPHGDSKNGLTHMSSQLVKYTVSDGYVVVWNSPITITNWTSHVQVLHLNSTSQSDPPVYYLSLLPTYQDECVAHANPWLSSRIRCTLVDVSGQTISRTNDLYMAGSNSVPFTDFPDFGAVGFNPIDTYFPSIMYITNSPPDAIPLQRLIDGRWYGPQDPFHYLKDLENHRTVTNDNGNIRMKMLAHSDMVFGIWSSTNLTNWTYQTNVVADEWGYVDSIIGQATADKNFYQLVYTNSP